MGADPGRPDLLQSAPRRRRTSRGERRVALCALAVAVAGALAAQGQRADRDAAVDLRVLPDVRESGEYDTGSGRAEVALRLELRNDGPRPVTVLSGGIAGYGVVRPVRVLAGATAPLRLARSVPCSAPAPPAPPPSRTLRLSVRTAAAARQVELALPAQVSDERAVRLCDCLGLEQAVGPDDPRRAPSTCDQPGG